MCFSIFSKQLCVGGFINVSGGVGSEVLREIEAKNMASIGQSQKSNRNLVSGPEVDRNTTEIMKLEINIEKITQLRPKGTILGGDINSNYYISIMWGNNQVELGRTAIVSGSKGLAFERAAFEISIPEGSILEECSLKFLLYKMSKKTSDELVGEVLLREESFTEFLERKISTPLPIISYVQKAGSFWKPNSSSKGRGMSSFFGGMQGGMLASSLMELSENGGLSRVPSGEGVSRMNSKSMFGGLMIRRSLAPSGDAGSLSRSGDALDNKTDQSQRNESIPPDAISKEDSKSSILPSPARKSMFGSFLSKAGGIAGGIAGNFDGFTIWKALEMA